MVNSANSDYIQATIEIFGFIIMLVMGFMFFMITRNRRKSEKILFSLLLATSVLLLADAGCYLFDGDPGFVAFLMNRIANFMVFLFNPISVMCAIGYTWNLIREHMDEEAIRNRIWGGQTSGGMTQGVQQSRRQPSHVSRLYPVAAFSLSGIAMLTCICNLFFRLIYYFDVQNIYHRLSGWYAYMALNELAIVMLLVMMARYRRCISVKQRLSIYIFLALPILGTIVQSIFPGVSYVQIGTTIGCVCVVVSYIANWMKEEQEKTGVSEERKNFWLIQSVFLIMILCISASVVSCIISVLNISQDNSEQDSKALCYMVSESVDGTFREPLNVLRTMAQTQVVIDALSDRHLGGSDLETDLRDYMTRIRKEYGYQTVFAASDLTKAYYTGDSFSRYMDLEEDGKDAWYSAFMSRESSYELNLDSDKDNGMAPSVFAYMKVKDSQGRNVGVCGVAMSLEKLMQMLERYEQQYDLSISLLRPSDGLVVVDTDWKRIGKVRMDLSYYYFGDEDVYYEKNSTRARMTRNMKALGWFLMVDDLNPNKLNIFRILLPSILIYTVGVVLLVVILLLYVIHENRKNRKLRESIRLSENDSLTGLKNRYSLDRYTEKVQLHGAPNPLTVVILDINGLKTVNDSYGHDAGDELIRGAAYCIRKAFFEAAEIYRTGGDEFCVICQYGEAEVLQRKAEVRTLATSWKSEKIGKLDRYGVLAISVGHASRERYPSASLDELIREADLMMYDDKKEFYSRTGMDRRRPDI